MQIQVLVAQAPEKWEWTLKLTILGTQKCSDPPDMQHRSDVSIRSHIGWDIADNAETSSQHRNRYVNETDLVETSLRRLIAM